MLTTNDGRMTEPKTAPATWRVSLRLSVLIALLTSASAVGSALFLTYLVRPYMVQRLPQDVQDSVWVLLLGALAAGLMAGVVGLGFGIVTSRRLGELVRQIEELAKNDTPQSRHPMVTELTALERAFGHLTLSIDRFVRDSDILAHLPQGILFIAPRGELVDYNAAAEAIMGFSLKPYLNKVVWGPDGLFCGSRENNRIKLLCEQAMTRTKPVSAGEVDIRMGEEGSPRLLELSFQKWQGEQEGCVLIVFQDSSEKQRIREQIRRADQLAFLGGLAAQLAHQVRTPLTVTRGLLELLESDSPPADLRQDYFERIMRSLERLDRLASSLLNLANPAPSSKEMINCARLLDDILTLDGVKKKNIELRTDYAPMLPYVLGDPHLLTEAFTNIIQNAIEATPSGGEISVRALPVSLETGLPMGARGVRVIIKNSGSGISADMRERIFEPFFTSKQEGTGLGLPIARRLIESHSGRISVESDGSSWTSFVVELPRLAVSTQPQLKVDRLG